MAKERAHLFIEFVREITDSSDSVIFSGYSSYYQTKILPENVKTEVRGYIVLIYRRIKGVNFNDPKLSRRYRICENFIEYSKSSKGKKNRPFVIQGKIKGKEGFSSEKILQPYLNELLEKKWIITHKEYRDIPIVGNVYLERE